MGVWNVFAFLDKFFFLMIPKSSSVSRCIQVNLSFFLDSSTLISPSPCTFFCVLSLSFIVLFLLEDPRRGVHIPTVPHVSHKSSAACTALSGCSCSHSGDGSLPTYQALLPLCWHRQSAPHTLWRRTSPHGWTWSPVFRCHNQCWSSCRFTRHSPCSFVHLPAQLGTRFLTPLLCSMASKHFFTQWLTGTLFLSVFARWTRADIQDKYSNLPISSCLFSIFSPKRSQGPNSCHATTA